MVEGPMNTFKSAFHFSIEILLLLFLLYKV